MLPHYVTGNQCCDYCDTTLYVDELVFIYDNVLFCEIECVKNHLFDMSGAKEVHLVEGK